MLSDLDIAMLTGADHGIEPEPTRVVDLIGMHRPVDDEVAARAAYARSFVRNPGRKMDPSSREKELARKREYQRRKKEADPEAERARNRDYYRSMTVEQLQRKMARSREYYARNAKAICARKMEKYYAKKNASASNPPGQ